MVAPNIVLFLVELKTEISVAKWKPKLRPKTSMGWLINKGTLTTRYTLFPMSVSSPCRYPSKSRVVFFWFGLEINILMVKIFRQRSCSSNAFCKLHQQGQGSTEVGVAKFLLNG